MPIERDEDLPSTLRRSEEHARRIFAETLNSAEQTYGPGERARRTAFAALKHSYEKVGDRWERKAQRGPSDEQAARGAPDAGEARPTAGGVDVRGHTKAELYARARELGVPRASRLSKEELGQAINKANQRETARARERERRAAG